MNINAKLIDLRQGGLEWHQHRAKAFNASELAAAMGLSSYISRSELIHQKATEAQPEINTATQFRFDEGHRCEAIARPWAEEIVGADLFPCVMAAEVGGLYLSASYDGQTMDGSVTWEHKFGNANLLRSLEGGVIPNEYHPQIEQGLLLSGASKCLFMASAGQRDTMRYVWYAPNDGLRGKIVPTWKQFEEDLANYMPTEKKPEAVGRTPDNLPALRIEVTGQVTASNLAEYREHALEVFKGINRELVTDQHFADAEQTIKWCKDVEDRLVAAKEHALSQTASIDSLFCTIDDISAEARATRLELNRLVTAEKENLRNKIRTDAEAHFANHIARINKHLSIVRLPKVDCNIAAAMKGKRTLATLQDAADSEVARAKIEANELATDISEKLTWFNDNVDNECRGLFRDMDDLVTMPVKHFEVAVTGRVEQHQKAEDERLERERTRIRAEEEARAQAETAQAAAPAALTAPTPIPAQPRTIAQPAAQAAHDDPATLRIGQINERLAPITLTAQGLADLGVEHSATDKAARLYRESDFMRICAALIARIDSVCQKEVA